MPPLSFGWLDSGTAPSAREKGCRKWHAFCREMQKPAADGCLLRVSVCQKTDNLLKKPWVKPGSKKIQQACATPKESPAQREGQAPPLSGFSLRIGIVRVRQRIADAAVGILHRFVDAADGSIPGVGAGNADPSAAQLFQTVDDHLTPP